MHHLVGPDTGQALEKAGFLRVESGKGTLFGSMARTFPCSCDLVKAKGLRGASYVDSRSQLTMETGQPRLHSHDSVFPFNSSRRTVTTVEKDTGAEIIEDLPHVKH